MEYLAIELLIRDKEQELLAFLSKGLGRLLLLAHEWLHLVMATHASGTPRNPARGLADGCQVCQIAFVFAKSGLQMVNSDLVSAVKLSVLVLELRFVLSMTN